MCKESQMDIAIVWVQNVHIRDDVVVSDGEKKQLDRVVSFVIVWIAFSCRTAHFIWQCFRMVYLFAATTRIHHTKQSLYNRLIRRTHVSS